MSLQIAGAMGCRGPSSKKRHLPKGRTESKMWYLVQLQVGPYLEDVGLSVFAELGNMEEER